MRKIKKAIRHSLCPPYEAKRNILNNLQFQFTKGGPFNDY